MMYRDYYAYLQKKLDSSLNALAQATRELEIAKKQGDDNAHKEAKEKAKQKIEEAARQAAEIERNLAYLFCEALGLKPATTSVLHGERTHERTVFHKNLVLYLMCQWLNICLPSVLCCAYLFNLENLILARMNVIFICLTTLCVKRGIGRHP